MDLQAAEQLNVVRSSRYHSSPPLSMSSSTENAPIGLYCLSSFVRQLAVVRLEFPILNSQFSIVLDGSQAVLRFCHPVCSSSVASTNSSESLDLDWGDQHAFVFCGIFDEERGDHWGTVIRSLYDQSQKIAVSSVLAQFREIDAILGRFSERTLHVFKAYHQRNFQPIPQRRRMRNIISQYRQYYNIIRQLI